MTALVTAQDATALLRSLGASPWLLRHHELVVEAAVLICGALEQKVGVSFDRDAVLLGAAVHDAGKIVHPEEMSASGSRHEVAGRDLLVRSAGVPAAIARFCVTHAAWNGADCTIEDGLVALADKLWKGKRDEALETHLTSVIVALTKLEPWEVFSRFDSICEIVAAAGPERLARSVV
jgi:hypothetical protein